MSSSSSDEYKEPPWAEKPRHDWSLLEIKGGVPVATHALQERSTTLLGRAADEVQIVLSHLSCSRQHARIAFDSSGTPWLRDLASTHGTTVNKKKLPPKACIGKQESNSTQTGARGVVLYPGDVLQFGASTRIFCVEGPEEFARGVVKKIPPKVNNKQQPSPSSTEGTDVSASVEQKQDSEGVSWGIDMDEPMDRDTSESMASLPLDLEEEKIPDKHRKEYERLKALHYKLENVKVESERIRRKGELSEGQERQLQRNEERQAKLSQDIREKESELYRKLYPDQSAASHATKRSFERALQDEEVEDRTSEYNKPGLHTDQDGETEQSLTAKWKALQKQIQQLQSDIDKAKERKSQAKKRLALLEAAGDEEAFFAKNDLDLAKDNVKALEKEQNNHVKAIQETERLLKIVNPSITVDRVTGYVGQGPPPSSLAPDTAMEPPPSRRQAQSLTDEEGAFVMPPPPPPPPPPSKKQKDNTPDKGSEASLSATAPSMSPPNKRKRVLGPTLPPPPPSAATSDSVRNEEPSVAGPSPPPPRGTLAMLSAASTAEKHSKGNSPKSGSQMQDTRSKSKEKAMTMPDPKKDIWEAPKDQDGSGMTKLNAKFAGRY